MVLCVDRTADALPTVRYNTLWQGGITWTGSNAVSLPLGLMPTPSIRGPVDVAEILLWNTCLTYSQRYDVKVYLEGKWGVQLPNTGNHNLTLAPIIIPYKQVVFTLLCTTPAACWHHTRGGMPG